MNSLWVERKGGREGGKEEGREGGRRKEVVREEGREEAMEGGRRRRRKEKGRNQGKDQSLWKEQWANKTREILIIWNYVFLSQLRVQYMQVQENSSGLRRMWFFFNFKSVKHDRNLRTQLVRDVHKQHWRILLHYTDICTTLKVRKLLHNKHIPHLTNSQFIVESSLMDGFQMSIKRQFSVLHVLPQGKHMIKRQLNRPFALWETASFIF